MVYFPFQKSPTDGRGDCGPTCPCDLACVWNVNDESGQGRVERLLKCPGLLPMSGHSRVKEDEEEACGCGEGISCSIVESGAEYDTVGLVKSLTWLTLGCRWLKRWKPGSLGPHSRDLPPHHRFPR